MQPQTHLVLSFCELHYELLIQPEKRLDQRTHQQDLPLLLTVVKLGAGHGPAGGRTDRAVVGRNQGGSGPVQ